MTRRRIGLAFILLGAAALVACAPVKKGPQLHSQQLACAGGPQTWLVPAGVTTATFDVYGAEGGTGGVPPATPEDPVSSTPGTARW